MRLITEPIKVVLVDGLGVPMGIVAGAGVLGGPVDRDYHTPQGDGANLPQPSGRARGPGDLMPANGPSPRPSGIP